MSNALEVRATGKLSEHQNSYVIFVRNIGDRNGSLQFEIQIRLEKRTTKNVRNIKIKNFLVQVK